MEPKPSRSRNRAEENESLVKAGVARVGLDGERRV